MIIYLKFINGKSYQVKIQSENTIYDIKNEIFKLQNISTDKQLIVFNNKILVNNDYTLEDYEITNGATIYCSIT